MLTIIAIGLAYGVIIAVGILLIVQLKCAFTNRTAIEDYICRKANHRHRKDSFIFPYDLGWRRNTSEIFNGGRSISRGNGVWWPIRHGCTQFTFSVEQLSQKAIKCHFSKIVLIAKNFSGGYFWSLSHGITLFLCQPWNGDLRLTISAGQMYVVTRGNRHWVYGHQLINENENFVKVPLRGWFPKECIDFTTHTAAVDNNNTDAVESSVSDESSEFG